MFSLYSTAAFAYSPAPFLTQSSETTVTKDGGVVHKDVKDKSLAKDLSGGSAKFDEDNGGGLGGLNDLAGGLGGGLNLGKLGANPLEGIMDKIQTPKLPKFNPNFAFPKPPTDIMSIQELNAQSLESDIDALDAAENAMDQLLDPAEQIKKDVTEINEAISSLLDGDIKKRFKDFVKDMKEKDKENGSAKDQAGEAMAEVVDELDEEFTEKIEAIPKDFQEINETIQNCEMPKLPSLGDVASMIGDMMMGIINNLEQSLINLANSLYDTFLALIDAAVRLALAPIVLITKTAVALYNLYKNIEKAIVKLEEKIQNMDEEKINLAEECNKAKQKAQAFGAVQVAAALQTCQQIERTIETVEKAQKTARAAKDKLKANKGKVKDKVEEGKKEAKKKFRDFMNNLGEKLKGLPASLGALFAKIINKIEQQVLTLYENFQDILLAIAIAKLMEKLGQYIMILGMVAKMAKDIKNMIKRLTSTPEGSEQQSLKKRIKSMVTPLLNTLKQLFTAIEVKDTAKNALGEFCGVDLTSKVPQMSPIDDPLNLPPGAPPGLPNGF